MEGFLTCCDALFSGLGGAAEVGEAGGDEARPGQLLVAPC